MEKLDNINVRASLQLRVSAFDSQGSANYDRATQRERKDSEERSNTHREGVKRLFPRELPGSPRVFKIEFRLIEAELFIENITCKRERIIVGDLILNVIKCR